MLKDAGALKAASIGLMVSMILSTSMWMNTGKPNEAAYSAGRSIMNALLGEIIIKLEGAAVKLAAQAGETAIAAGKKMQEYAGKALKDFDFGDFLDSVKNRLSWKQQVTDPDSLLGMDFKEAVKNAGTDALENVGSHLSADAKELLNRQIEDGLVTHNNLKDLENFLEWGSLNNLDSNQLRAALVCDPDSMSHKEFQSIMEWTGSHSSSLNNVTGDGITCLSNRWDDLGSIGAQDETMKQLEQESAKLAAGGEQMNAADVKEVVKKAEKAVAFIDVDDKALKHSTVGEFTEDPKTKVVSRMKGGGHGQANIDFLNANGFEYNIVMEYPNGVRVGNVPKHKEPIKRTGIGQSWFPKTWSENKIKEAGIFVANLPENKILPDGVIGYGEYDGVRVGIIKTHGRIATIFPDANLQ